MSDIVVDTHATIWYLTDVASLSRYAEIAIDQAASSGSLFISAITLIELVYLTEKGRLPTDVLDILHNALDDPTTGFRLVDINRGLADIVASIPRQIVPDMPDRIIAATALFLKIPVVTKDSAIHNLATVQAVW